MESRDELKKIDIKWYNYIIGIKWYYLINGIKINFSNILLDKKLYEHISFNISQKTTIDPKPLRIRFNKKWIYYIS